MQDNISTLPTSNDAVNQGDIDFIKSICGVNTSSDASISLTMLLYVTIICFIVSSPQIEDILTKYLEFTCNSTFLLNITKSAIFFCLAYVLFYYLMK